MPTFGIVGEGITDQIVLEQILLGHFGDDEEEPAVNYVQPLLDVTGKKGAPEPGGWSLVLKWLELGRHKEALQFNDYLVIQIDTDVSQQKGYDVPWRDGGKDLTVEELVARVVGKLVGLIGAEFYAAHKSRFLFAVAVNEIECWLLPLFFVDNKAAKTTGCLEAISHEQRRRNEAPLLQADSKDPKRYREVARQYNKPKILRKSYPKNRSFELFIQQLDALQLQPSASQP